MINTSDGTFGALVASESIGIAETVVNGPGGCRDRAHILIGTMVDTDPENMGCCAVKNYSKRTGIPCTFLNGNDIIFGAEEKLESSLTDIEKVSKKDLAVIETLGASLICTDQEKIRQEHPGMIPIRDDLSSMDFAGGFDICSVRILEKTLTGERVKTERPSVNILGYNVSDLGYEDGIVELERMLNAMGVEVICALGCRPTKEQVVDSRNAWANIMVHPECSVKTAELYHRMYGIECLRPSEGAPFGYYAMRSFLLETADMLGIDAKPALDLLDREQKIIHRRLLRAARKINVLRGRRMQICGPSSTVLPIVKWLYGSYAVVPYSIILDDQQYAGEISSFLKEKGFDGILGKEPQDCDVNLVDGYLAAEINRTSDTAVGVAFCVPYGFQTNLCGHNLVGLEGNKYILDSILNGIPGFVCALPPEIDRY